MHHYLNFGPTRAERLPILQLHVISYAKQGCRSFCGQVVWHCLEPLHNALMTIFHHFEKSGSGVAEGKRHRQHSDVIPATGSFGQVLSGWSPRTFEGRISYLDWKPPSCRSERCKTHFHPVAQQPYNEGEQSPRAPAVSRAPGFLI